MSWGVLALAGTETPQRVARTLDLPLIGDPLEASRIVHVGTDSSLAAVADRVGPDHPILHHPVGGSDLMRMFGPADLADRLAAGSPYPIEVLEARSEVGRHVVVGHAVASASGRLPRVLAGCEALMLHRDGRDDEVEGAALVVANCQHVDGKTLAPRAALMDGRLDLQIIGGGRLERVRLRRSMHRGLHMRSPAIYRRSVATVTVELPDGWVLRCDGRRVRGTRWTLAVVPAAATLWV